MAESEITAYTLKQGIIWGNSHL